ncbi:MAG: hypothetical protein GTO24_08350, partial [candidate division Zixibacteria bacterium]|nr:hypothetical protein [candidate division Zixibacteria bacterium]
ILKIGNNTKLRIELFHLGDLILQSDNFFRKETNLLLLNAILLLEIGDLDGVICVFKEM